MDRPHVVSRGEWLIARTDLLAWEKEATQAKETVDAALVSRAPLASITRFQQRMGWPMPWYFSLGSGSLSGEADCLVRRCDALRPVGL